MGYHTDFWGEFQLDRPLAPEHKAYLKKFNETRRVNRLASAAELLGDPCRVAAGLPIGEAAGYFVGGTGFMGQGHDVSIIDSNRPPPGQPGLWCQWTPNEAGTAIVWDEGEKFYDYVEWIEYIIEHFLKPWGYTLNGKVNFQGEEQGDIGIIVVEDTEVGMERGQLIAPGATITCPACGHQF